MMEADSEWKWKNWVQSIVYVIFIQYHDSILYKSLSTFRILWSNSCVNEYAISSFQAMTQILAQKAYKCHHLIFQVEVKRRVLEALNAWQISCHKIQNIFLGLWSSSSPLLFLSRLVIIFKLSSDRWRWIGKRFHEKVDWW